MMDDKTEDAIVATSHPRASIKPISPKRPLAEIIQDLSKRVPDQLLSKVPVKWFEAQHAARDKENRECRKRHYPLDLLAYDVPRKYIPWYNVVRLLNHYAPGWIGEIRNIAVPGKTANTFVTVVYRITLRGSDGEVCREASATSTMDYNDHSYEITLKVGSEVPTLACEGARPISCNELGRRRRRRSSNRTSEDKVTYRADSPRDSIVSGSDASYTTVESEVLSSPTGLESEPEVVTKTREDVSTDSDPPTPVKVQEAKTESLSNQQSPDSSEESEDETILEDYMSYGLSGNLGSDKQVDGSSTMVQPDIVSSESTPPPEEKWLPSMLSSLTPIQLAVYSKEKELTSKRSSRPRRPRTRDLRRDRTKSPRQESRSDVSGPLSPSESSRSSSVSAHSADSSDSPIRGPDSLHVLNPVLEEQGMGEPRKHSRLTKEDYIKQPISPKRKPYDGLTEAMKGFKNPVKTSKKMESPSKRQSPPSLKEPQVQIIPEKTVKKPKTREDIGEGSHKRPRTREPSPILRRAPVSKKETTPQQKKHESPEKLTKLSTKGRQNERSVGRENLHEFGELSTPKRRPDNDSKWKTLPKESPVTIPLRNKVPTLGSKLDKNENIPSPRKNPKQIDTKPKPVTTPPPESNSTGSNDGSTTSFDDLDPSNIKKKREIYRNKNVSGHFQVRHNRTHGDLGGHGVKLKNDAPADLPKKKNLKKKVNLASESVEKVENVASTSGTDVKHHEEQMRTSVRRKSNAMPGSIKPSESPLPVESTKPNFSDTHPAVEEYYRELFESRSELANEEVASSEEKIFQDENSGSESETENFDMNIIDNKQEDDQRDQTTTIVEEVFTPSLTEAEDMNNELITESGTTAPETRSSQAQAVTEIAEPSTEKLNAQPSVQEYNEQSYHQEYIAVEVPVHTLESTTTAPNKQLQHLISVEESLATETSTQSPTESSSDAVHEQLPVQEETVTESQPYRMTPESVPSTIAQEDGVNDQLFAEIASTQVVEPASTETDEGNNEEPAVDASVSTSLTPEKDTSEYQTLATNPPTRILEPTAIATVDEHSITQENISQDHELVFASRKEILQPGSTSVDERLLAPRDELTTLTKETEHQFSEEITCEKVHEQFLAPKDELTTLTTESEHQVSEEITCEKVDERLLAPKDEPTTLEIETQVTETEHQEVSREITFELETKGEICNQKEAQTSNFEEQVETTSMSVTPPQAQDDHIIRETDIKDSVSRVDSEVYSTNVTEEVPQEQPKEYALDSNEELCNHQSDDNTAIDLKPYEPEEGPIASKVEAIDEKHEEDLLHDILVVQGGSASTKEIVLMTGGTSSCKNIFSKRAHVESLDCGVHSRQTRLSSLVLPRKYSARTSIFKQDVSPEAKSRGSPVAKLEDPLRKSSPLTSSPRKREGKNKLQMTKRVEVAWPPTTSPSKAPASSRSAAQKYYAPPTKHVRMKTPNKSPARKVKRRESDDNDSIKSDETFRSARETLDSDKASSASSSKSYLSSEDQGQRQAPRELDRKGKIRFKERGEPSNNQKGVPLSRSNLELEPKPHRKPTPLGTILSKQASPSPERRKVTPLTLGLETTGGVMTVIFPRGTCLPVEKKQTISTHIDNQTELLIHIFEGERLWVSNNKLLGSFEVKGITPLPRGTPLIHVFFKVTSGGLLNVYVMGENILHGQSMREVVVSNVSIRPDKQEIREMIEEGEEHQQEDERDRRSIQLKESLENYVYKVRGLINKDEVASFLEPHEKQELMDVLQSGLDWLHETNWFLYTHQQIADFHEIETQKHQLQTSCQRILEEVFKNHVT